MLLLFVVTCVDTCLCFQERVQPPPPPVSEEMEARWIDLLRTDGKAKSAKKKKKKTKKNCKGNKADSKGKRGFGKGKKGFGKGMNSDYKGK